MTIVPDETPKVWAFARSGKVQRLMDLQLEVIDTISKTRSVPWTTVLDLPLSDLGVAQDIARACADALNVDLPDAFTVKALIECFELVPDDVPPVEDEQGEPDPLSSGSDQQTAG